jgi:tagatose 6-phosphate kinase
MILTVTLNPSVDIRFTVDEFYKDGVFRAKENQQTAGGKGLNVSRVLNQLGSPVTATGFLGGSNGHFIKQELDKTDIMNDFIQIQENTRVCIAVLSQDSQTEVLGKGPVIEDQDLTKFIESYSRLLQKTEIVCISGSQPPGIPATFYKDLIHLAHKEKVKVLLDTSGEPLNHAVTAEPYLVKPNIDELQALLNTRMSTESEIIGGMHRLASSGIKVVIVSMGSKGALALKDDKVYRIHIPAVTAVNPVGSGDSMIAGMAHALYRESNFTDMLTLGAACGISNAMQMKTGFIDTKEVESIAKQISIKT